MSSLPLKAFALGAALGLVLAVAPSCGSANGACGPDNCQSGCCANGICLSGTALNACGKSGASCASCENGKSCASGVCSATQFTGGGQGGGNGGTGGGGGSTNVCNASNCQTGCCFRGSCFTGRAIDACGTGGAVCETCAANLVCPSGACVMAPVVVDSGVADSGVDSGVSDSGVSDSGVNVDGGVTDGGSVDSGITDAGAVDSGVVDSGAPTDSGMLDAGTIDAGQVDAGPVDAGTFGGDGGMCHPNVTISQVYINFGFNDGFNAQFVELHNRSSIDVDLSTWSIQVSRNGNNNWTVVPLTGTLPAYGFVLVQGKTSGTGGGLPMPYIVGGEGWQLRVQNGMEVALVSNQTAISGACPSGGAVVDMMGYGSQADCWEGGGGDGPLGFDSSHNVSYQRDSDGCEDTNSTSADWSTSNAAAPRTASTPGNVCACH